MGSTSGVDGTSRPDWRSLGALAGLDEGALRAGCVRRRFERGETVFHATDPAGSLHLIDKGRVAVRLTTALGEVATLDILGVGDTFGEQALIDGVGERTATITALERVETLALNRDRFDRLRLDHPGIDQFLLMVVSARLQRTSRQLRDALFLPADTRVLRCVADLYDMFCQQPGSAIPLTQVEIASMTGVTRSTVNRILKQAEADNLLTISRSRIDILNPKTLRHRVGIRD
ncbi:MAG: Crp/Fnr family transcriptional regulator [Acidimicrobiales bacterium]